MKSGGKIYSEGCVHGRFQPPHKGHEEYILAAFSQCTFLWIGITRYDIRHFLPCDVDQHRAERFNNPLTYFERISILKQMLADNGLPSDSFGFIPFPVDEPEKLLDFLPNTVPCFTTIYDEWNKHKIQQLENSGYKVIVLWERKEKMYNGVAVRKLIMDGSDLWQDMVPAATRNAIQQLDIRERLLRLAND